MKKKLFIYIFLCVFQTHCMEEKVKDKKAIAKKSDAFERTEELISYLEAHMSGENFCPDIPSKMVRFKHYSKDKEYTRLFNDLQSIETTSPELIPNQETIDYFYREYDVIIAHSEQFIQKKALERQLQRFSQYTKDRLYAYHQNFLHIKYLLTKMNGIPQEERRALDGFTKSTFENNEEYLGLIAQRNKNRFAMHKALEAKNFTMFRKACQKKTWLDYEPLRDTIHKKGKVLPENFKKISIFIAFIDAIYSGGNFEIVENGLQFQHFKKNHKSFSVNPHTPFHFNGEYFSQALTNLTDSILSRSKHDDYILLLSLLSHNQRKAVIFFKEFLSYINGPRYSFQDLSKEGSLEKLKTMNAYEKMHLDGFDITQQNDPKYCEEYIDTVIEIQANFNEMNALKKNELEKYIAVCKKPLSIAYIPFKERLKQREEEIAQLSK